MQELISLPTFVKIKDIDDDLYFYQLNLNFHENPL
jgi:hypothetical protein